MTEEKCDGTYSVDDARRKAGANECTEWFIAKIETAAEDGKHHVRLVDVYRYSTEEQAALYDLERMGFRIELVKRHYSSKNGATVEDSFYAFW